MKQYILQDTTYHVPTDLSEITWSQYIDFDKIVRNDTHGTFIKIAKLVSLFVKGFSYEAINLSEPHIILDMYEQLSFLFAALDNLPTDKQEIVTVNGEDFIVHDLSESFIEFATYAKIEQDFKKVPLEAVPIQLAHILRKPGEDIQTLTPALLQERITLFRELDAATVLRLNNFFLFRAKAITTGTQAYLQLKTLTTQQGEITLESLLKNMDGWERLPTWRKTLLRWIVYLKKKQIQYSGGW